MATAVSLTETKIRELLSGWESVGLSQEQINALVDQLWTRQTTVESQMEHFENEVLPSIQQDVQESSQRVSELNETVLPNLEAGLNDINQQVENIMLVDIPSIQDNFNSELLSAKERPKVFVQPEPPDAWDDLEDRELVVGDTWFDSDDNNMQRIWNGVEWTTFGVDIPDFSITVKKFMSTSHMIY